MKIENNLKVGRLIDTYGKLLTPRQYDIITSYYFDNLSLSEIGYNFTISRQAVSDSINQSIKALEAYEDKLGLVKREDLLIDEISTLGIDNPNLLDRINKIIEHIRG
jgi:predicted DNA-binding protein YlxM (UPF0122 family)